MNQTAAYVAHAREREDGGYDVHTVEEHLRDTATLAGGFAEAFGSGDWARLIALLHDLGKYHPEFQAYIRRETGYDPDAHVEDAPGRVDHSTLGAIHVLDLLGDLGRIAAYPIAGHHAGLPDWESREGGGGTLDARLRRNCERLAAVLAEPIPDDFRSPERPTSRPPAEGDTNPLRAALWVRMLFSCLVDADYLDTERFLDPGRAETRGRYPDLDVLSERFDRFMDEMAKKVSAAGPLSPVNVARAEVLRQCREKAAREGPFFSLTVPTGGGKTLSSMAFALDHAREHRKRRVIYVIPYTSIIEQTADVFRRVFGSDSLVEHHSNLDPRKETLHSRVAAENWDAPLVVTTAVQFWESLFAARPGRCRKLHRIADSVVVLDEAQLLPPPFLNPILTAMRELASNYGVTFVLCTATQPALEERRTPDFRFPGLPPADEIVDDPERLHGALKRVTVDVPEDLHTPSTWEEVAARISDEPAALCIVNRRDDARDLYRLLPKESRVHLSALMCGQHRSRTLRTIRRRLKRGERLHVVSTQLVEAGVDLDFPVVFRALAGLDSIAQAAGRCNREGLLRDGDGALTKGRVIVFVPPKPAPAGLLRMAEQGGRQSLGERADDPLAPACFGDYFRELYWKHGDKLDEKRILEHLDHGGQLKIRFRTAAEAFRLIPDTQLPIVVRYRNHSLLRRLEHVRPGRDDLRRLQRFVVSVPRPIHDALATAGKIREVHPGVWVQEYGSMYDRHLGLLTEEPEVYEAADLIG